MPCSCPGTPSPRPWRSAGRGLLKSSHGHIFTAITSLFSQGEPADWVTVTEELRRRGLLETIGDPSVFVSLQANTPSIGNADYYARIIEEHALLRRLVSVAGEITELGYSVPEDVSESSTAPRAWCSTWPSGGSWIP